MSLMYPILIAGCPRSGNSMVAGIVYLCGAFGGRMNGSSKYTRRGSFQNTEIRQKLMRTYLMEIGVDIRGQDKLPDTSNLPESELTVNLKREAEMIMQFQGCGNEPWFYKDTGLTFTWPIWHKAFPKAKWIIVRRNKDDIVASCLHTTYMTACSTASDWSLWVSKYEEEFKKMKEAGLSLCEVFPSDFFKYDLTGIVQAIRFAGLRWKEMKVQSFLDLRQGGKNGSTSNS